MVVIIALKEPPHPLRPRLGKGGQDLEDDATIHEHDPVGNIPHETRHPPSRTSRNQKAQNQVGCAGGFG